MSNNLPAVLQGMDLSGYTEAERQQIIAFYQAEMQESAQGVDLRVSRIKISRDTLQFVDEMGDTSKELRGVIVFKQKTRGYWDRTSDSDIPTCSSVDGVTGILSADQSQRACASCPLNAWGSAVDENGNPTAGKACKEMRRVFVLPEGSSLPVVITLPPTSITPFDKYISARLAKGIADIATETVFGLAKESGGKFTYAVITCQSGAPVPPMRMMEFAKIRTSLQAAASRMTVVADDYDAGGSDTTTADDPFATEQAPV